MQKILITGGAGYIGSHVTKELLKRGDYEITIVDNLSTGFAETIERIKQFYGDVDFIKLDLSDWDEVNKLLGQKKFDAIIHFAAALVVPESVENPLKYYLNNTANTANLIKAAVQSGVGKFIFSSTAAVYGEPETIPATGITEKDETSPINPYGHSKLMSEQVLADSAKAYDGFKYVALRYFNVAGADIGGKIGQSTKNATHLIKVAAETALGKRDKIYIFGDDYPTPDGTCIRDYIHVDDLSLAHLEALDYLDDHESDVFNVGYGKGYSVKEVIDTMKRVSGNDFAVEITGRRAGDPAMLIANSQKLQKATNWKPKYDNLELICKTALEWEKNL
ncbi:UDP-glucose 4-epimerase [Nitratiruptor sp. YY08-26]|uniref:UDP-glucose 4-epimerase GalE n=1 Tax=unclassified Nitratiruptor TaxID=2624044 RepID=UPI001916818D|nr:MULTISPECIES: UDP-glucose 4-epimerase GalE [unclassified Nitratiruptor]BCD62555.1 UDP-glucose 4-epimerase [Nitratiruptor sp. YY08-13]BCD66491.1 UDP-glucose 4-epimerase [Nitratiruptor sp. YY08-26]